MDLTARSLAFVSSRRTFDSASRNLKVKGFSVLLIIGAYPSQKGTIYERALSANAAMSLTFFSSVFANPKNEAIWMI